MTIRTEVGHWALVPSWVRKALRGQSRALELYVLLADVANHDDNVAQRRRGWLAKEMDCSPDTVDRAMAVLVRVGAVSVERRYDGDGANLASNYLVHQVPPAEPIEGAGRTDAARVEEESNSADAEGDGRGNAARGPHESGEVAAETREGRRGDAAVIDQPPINQPPISQLERVRAPLSPPPADDALPEEEGRIGEEVERPRPRRKARKAAPVVSEDALRLATLIRDLSQEHADRTGQGFKVTITDASIKDADRLLTRGPLSPDDNDRVIVPEPIPYERAERLLRYVFAHPERESSGFSWADQIRSPGNLRKNWYKAAGWANAQREAAKTGGRNGRRNEPQPAPDDIDGLAAMPLVDLLRRGLPAMDVVRVGAALRERAAALSAPEREMLRRALEDERNFPRDGFTPTQVDVVLADLKPRNVERSRAAAADLAVWGAIPAPTEPLALPGGTTQ